MEGLINLIALFAAVILISWQVLHVRNLRRIRMKICELELLVGHFTDVCGCGHADVVYNQVLKECGRYRIKLTTFGYDSNESLRNAAIMSMETYLHRLTAYYDQEYFNYRIVMDIAAKKNTPEDYAIEKNARERLGSQCVKLNEYGRHLYHFKESST